ncbi:MAG: rRNA maturation RNase YbeY [Nitrospinae bacterium]|jgi:probable rRNA maturation factor|nr:rRNA maturation RNase YbeY [Nitrospinota bacterium]MDA1109315.1 rRNA maturation RNase YbeY [Nitrospinota bacterium]
MDIQIQNDQEIHTVDTAKFKRQVKKILQTLECHDDELSILIVDDAKIRQLNHQYRNIDTATDVLSFPQNEGEDTEFISQMLGDVVISVETAHRQAMEHQFSLEQELVLLLIHGTLHLLGYDHERSLKEEKIMKEKTWDLFALIFPGKAPSESCQY